MKADVIDIFMAGELLHQVDDLEKRVLALERALSRIDAGGIARLQSQIMGCLRRLTSIRDEMRDLRKDPVKLSKPTRPGFTTPPPLPEKQTYSERLKVQDDGVKAAPPPWVRGWWQFHV